MLSCLRPALKKRKREDGDVTTPASAAEPEVAVPVSAGGTATEGASAGEKAKGSSSVLKKAVRFLRGKKCEQKMGSADPSIDRTPIELPFTCDGCGNYILTARHNCGGCEDFDLCEPCFKLYQAEDPEVGLYTTSPLFESQLQHFLVG